MDNVYVYFLLLSPICQIVVFDLFWSLFFRNAVESLMWWSLNIAIVPLKLKTIYKQCGRVYFVTPVCQITILTNWFWSLSFRYKVENLNERLNSENIVVTRPIFCVFLLKFNLFNIKHRKALTTSSYNQHKSLTVKIFNRINLQLSWLITYWILIVLDSFSAIYSSKT